MLPDAAASLPNVSPFKERIINCVKRRRAGFYAGVPQANRSPSALSPFSTPPYHETRSCEPVKCKISPRYARNDCLIFEKIRNDTNYEKNYTLS